MPYESKPGTRKYGNNPMKPAATKFTLRSGNGPLQFKQMGASPAKNLLGSVMSAFGGGAKQADIMNQEAARINKPTNEKAITITAKTDEVTPDKPRVATPKELRKKHKAEGNKVTLKERKAAGEGTVASRAWKGVKKGVKKAGKKIKDFAEKRYEGLSPEERQAKFQDDMDTAAGLLDQKGKDAGRYRTDRLEKHRASKKADELHAVKMENVKRDQLETDLMNDMRQLKKDAYLKDLEVPASTTAHVNEETGEAEFVSQAELRKNKPV